MSDLPNMDRNPLNVSKSASNGLTGIHGSIHCPASDVPTEAEYDELDDIAIEHFLDVLAGVALAVAAREIEEDPGRNG